MSIRRNVRPASWFTTEARLMRDIASPHTEVDHVVTEKAFAGPEDAGMPDEPRESLRLPDRHVACLAEPHIHDALPEALRQSAW
jgi:hypothetical protein